MAATVLGLSGLQTAISVPLFVTTVAASALVTSALLSNEFMGASADTYPDEASLWLTLGASFAPASADALQAVTLPSLDGTNTETPFVSGTQLYPFGSALFSTFPLAAATYASGSIFRIPLAWHAAAKFKIALFNPTSVGLTISAAAIYPFGGSAG